jgi:hypothetical protein
VPEVTRSETASDPTSRTPVKGEPSEVDRPIFVVGCYRSGTSLLSQLLDSHPRISSGPEDPLLEYLAKLDNDFWRDTLKGFGFTEEEWLTEVRGTLENLQSRYTQIQGKTRFADKNPGNSPIIGYLDKLYPNCQVIHIVRNPRDVIASSRIKFGKAKGAFYGGRWVVHVRSAESDGAKLGGDRFRTIRYEDLVADPEKVMKDLIAWLGEPWSDEVLQFGRTHRYPPHYPPAVKAQYRKKGTVYDTSVGRGKIRESVIPLLYVHLRARDLLRKFDY